MIMGAAMGRAPPPFLNDARMINHVKSSCILPLKGEIHSKINSMWKERVHFFLQNNAKMMKIG